jgi:hypothetical protein
MFYFLACIISILNSGNVFLISIIGILGNNILPGLSKIQLIVSYGFTSYINYL